MPRFSFDIRAMMMAGQVIDYFEDQFQLTGSLPAKIKEQILVRLYPADFGWRQKERWFENFPSVAFDAGDKSIAEMGAKCRLFIVTYNATAPIECLSINFPTVMFWNSAHWELKSDAEPYFQMLKEVGIYHESVESAALFISEIWDDIPSWWQSDKVQIARQVFCDRYAANSSDMNHQLKKIFLEEASQAKVYGAR